MTTWEVVAMSVVHNLNATSLAEYDIDERLHVTCCHLRVRDMTVKATATHLLPPPQCALRQSIVVAWGGGGYSTRYWPLASG